MGYPAGGWGFRVGVSGSGNWAGGLSNLRLHSKEKRRVWRSAENVGLS